MTLFYRGPSARITHEVLEVRCPSYQSFTISELQSVHVVRQKVARVSATSVKVSSIATAGVSVVLAAVAWPVFGLLLTSLAALAVLLTCATVAIALWRTHGTSLELWGTYRGRPTRLYRTTDRLTFGQVSRALRRVLELVDERR